MVGDALKTLAVNLKSSLDVLQFIVDVGWYDCFFLVNALIFAFIDMLWNMFHLRSSRICPILKKLEQVV